MHDIAFINKAVYSKIFFHSRFIGMPDLSPRLNSLLILCLEVHKEMLYDELEPLDLSELLFEERAIEILTHDKITETRQRQKQIKRLLETVQKNENNCFHFFLYILQRNEYNYIRKKLEGPAPEPLKRGIFISS